MATPANIVLNDGTNDHTFTPVAVSTQGATLVSREGTTSAGNPKIVLQLDFAHTGRQTNKVRVQLSLPIEVTVEGVTSVRSTPLFVANVVLPDDMTQAERDIFGAMVVDLVSEALVRGYYEDLDPIV